MKFKLLLCFGFLSLSAIGQSKTLYDIFYISIGSSHYVNNDLVDSTGEMTTIFRNIKGANKSSRMVSRFLQQKGALGLDFTSDEDSLITKEVFFKGISSINATIKSRKSKHPFIIYYYCGHGISEVVSEMRYMIPGNMVGDISKMHVDAKKVNAVCLNDVYDSLGKLDIPFVIILDCCADKEMDIRYLSNVFSKTAKGNILDIIKVIAAVNSIKGRSPVICSSKLGEPSFTAADPLDSSSSLLVGPLCRRLLLLKEANKMEKINARTFLSLLVNLQDRETPRPVLLSAKEVNYSKFNLW